MANSTHYRIVHYELQDIIWDNILQFIEGCIFKKGVYFE